jgi:hypothetical protein
MSVEKLFSTVDGDASLAHKSHLVTLNFAEHNALGAFYADVRDAMDSFIEASIGVDNTQDLFGNELDDDIVAQLETSHGDLVGMRTDVCKGNAALENKFDELTAVYLKALYMLRMS